MRYDLRMAGNGILIRISFSCEKGHTNEIDWRVFPARDNPLMRFQAEQGAFARAFTSKHQCALCGASIGGNPKVEFQEI
jgi:hypothetical protein